MKKMEIPDVIREILRCVECNEFLSCGPVYLVHETSSAICGRCSQQPEEQVSSTLKIKNRSRNLQYEATAELLAFPCPYSNQGCPVKLNFSAEGPNKHENDCKFRKFFCPIVPRESCNWVGSRYELKDHCEEAHPGHFFRNQCVLPQPNVTNSNFGNFLVAAFRILFLVQTKVCVTSGKFFHSVRMFGDPNFLDKFTYTLEIEGNNKKMTQKSSVLPAKILTLQESSAKWITINQLKEFLDSSKFTITIETVVRNCENCSGKIEHLFDSKFCVECASKFIRCEFSGKGCSFVDVNKKKCGKHEFYFCEYQRKCFRCGVFFYNGSFIEHLSSTSSCSNTIKYNIDSVVRLTPNVDNNFKFMLLSSENIGTVICSYDLFDCNLYLRVFTSLTSLELKNYKCSIELTDPQTKHAVVTMPQIKYKTCDDWFIDEKMNHFPSWKSIGIDVKINIDKM